MRSILRASQFTPTLLWQRSRWYVSVFSRCNSPAQPASESGRIRKSARRANLTRTSQQMWWNDSPLASSTSKALPCRHLHGSHSQSLGISPLPNYVPSQTAARIAEPCLSSHGPEETSVLRLQAAAAAPSEQGPGILWVHALESKLRICEACMQTGQCWKMFRTVRFAQHQTIHARKARFVQFCSKLCWPLSIRGEHMAFQNRARFGFQGSSQPTSRS